MTRLSDEQKIRLEKLKKISEKGIDPYPAQTTSTHTCQQALAEFDDLEKGKKLVTLVGRIRSLRLHGGSCFAHIDDGTEKMQVYFKKDLVGNEHYQFLTDLIDIGDFIEMAGKLFITKKGEKTLLVEKFKIITKALSPLPEKWHGLSDVEIRYRQRYLDLIANPEVKAIFQKRSLIVKAIREFLDSEGFLEVETPVLQPIPGGANARPFKTHHQALGTDLYLRIAPELYLKRLIIGGINKVYEIARCFRNEGIDREHNPEFTQVEFYMAYMDYEQLMKFTEEMTEEIIEKVNKKLTLEYEGKTIDFTPPYPRITFREALKKYAKLDMEEFDTKEKLLKEVKRRGLEINQVLGYGKTIEAIYKEWVRPEIINPTFITQYPTELSPLAKKLPGNPKYTQRFQLLVAGTELMNAFSELNDPIDQKERFEAQEKLRKAGDEETQRIDHDFIEALEHGMPPTAGFGMGIDRLTAILINAHNIKEVILFPTLKPKK